MNLIITGRENSSAEVEQLRNRNCVVEIMPSDRLPDRLKQNLDFLLFADAIACFIEVDAIELGSPLATFRRKIHFFEKPPREAAARELQEDAKAPAEGLLRRAES